MSEEIRLTGLERLLVRGTYMSVEDVVAASRRAKEADIDLITYIQQKQLLSDLDIAQIVSNSVGFEYIDLDANYKAHSVPKNLVSEKLIIKHKILPLFFKDEVLHVAISNPAHIQFVDKIKFETGKKVVIHVAEHSKIQHYIDSVYGQFETGKVVTTEELVKSIMSDGTFQDIDDEDDDGGFNNDYDASAPAIQFINKMLKDAVRMKASDLHFEPFEKHYRIRFRIDGVLRFVEQLPSMVSTRLSSRLKVMAGMDISEKRNPQDGRIRLHLTDSRSIDFRVNSLPTVYGEKIVLRILDSSSAQLGIDQLGYEPDQKEMFLEALHKPQGMVLITGPTGSGKTVSLYTGLNILNEMDTNISTAEDPVEINLDGINQVNVNPKAGLTFATVLKAFLRQDPDVIMVGEIRDLETAEIAIKAAQTGHMVMSTLHTNSAPETLTRLRNMGIPAFNVATSVNLVIAQRLARKLCDKCKTEYHAPREILEGFGFTAAQLDDPNFKIYSAVGCQDCVEGYKGRVGVYEVMKITPEISRIIMRDGNAIEIADASKKAGFNTLRESGINKILAGLTSMSEILRITSDSGVTLD